MNNVVGYNWKYSSIPLSNSFQSAFIENNSAILYRTMLKCDAGASYIFSFFCMAPSSYSNNTFFLASITSCVLLTSEKKKTVMKTNRRRKIIGIFFFVHSTQIIKTNSFVVTVFLFNLFFYMIKWKMSSYTMLVHVNLNLISCVKYEYNLRLVNFV